MLRTGTGLATCSGQVLVLPHAYIWFCWHNLYRHNAYNRQYFFFKCGKTSTCPEHVTKPVTALSMWQDQYLSWACGNTCTCPEHVERQVSILSMWQSKYTGTGLATCSGQVLVLPHAYIWFCWHNLYRHNAYNRQYFFFNYSSTRFLIKKDRYKVPVMRVWQGKYLSWACWKTSTWPKHVARQVSDPKRSKYLEQLIQVTI
jgi:hypothetical protein